jgi:hypothetical protein
MKYIAFGIGKVYKAYCNSEIKRNIIAYTDNNFVDANEFEERPVIKPSKISEWAYDYVIIFSTKFFEEIYKQLVNDLNVSEKKIISFWDIVQEGKHIALQRCGMDILELIRKMQWLKILDFSAFFSNLYYSRKSMKIENEVSLDAFVLQLEKIYPIFTNLYERIFYSADCDLPEYDAVIWPYIFSKSKNMQEELPVEIGNNTRYLLIILPYKCDFKENDKDFIVQTYGNIVHTEYKAHGKFFIIDMKPIVKKNKTKIYIVSHKEFQKPEDPFYEPIYVGKYGKEKEFMRSDSRGNNIAKYNLFINETTALYWIWKHSKDDYVGMCHYRRFFLQDEEKNIRNILSNPFADSILEKYDIILPQTILLENVKEQLERHVDLKAFDEGWKIITCLIKKKQPDYWDSFEYFFNCAKIMYPCNMFVTRKKIADCYCEWLFSFILDVVKVADFSVYDNYSQRMIGFFIERLFNVWLLKQDLKIKELPVLLTDEM